MMQPPWPTSSLRFSWCSPASTHRAARQGAAANASGASAAGAAIGQTTNFIGAASGPRPGEHPQVALQGEERNMEMQSGMQTTVQCMRT